MVRVVLIVVGIAVIAAVCYGLHVVHRGFSAHEQPSEIEAFVARAARRASIPSDARNKKNPVQLTDAVLVEARRHFADHCATCHANDGSGNTEIGQNVYPKAPDMRQQGTQKLTDAEIFYIIHNGVRLTAMPAWGSDEGEDLDSWKLVHFIRHLPKLTPEELADMKKFNPVSPADVQEENEEEQFLKGGPAPAQHHHH
jgi:mono/diheme cytochrome c family protein